MTKNFIVIVHPHQKPARVMHFDDEQEFVDDWENGVFSTWSANNSDDYENICYEEAMSDLMHDVHSVTRLDNVDEIKKYIIDCRLRPRHRSGISELFECLRSLFSEDLFDLIRFESANHATLNKDQQNV